MVLSYSAGMKGARVDGATASVGSEEFRKGGVEIVRNERGDDVFVAIRDDKEVTCTNSVEVVLPARTGEDAWLRACRTGSASFCVSIHHFGC